MENNNKTNIPTNNKLNKNKEIRNRGWITQDKREGVFRVLFMNPHGLGPDSDEKIAQIQKESKARRIDCIMLSSTDYK